MASVFKTKAGTWVGQISIGRYPNGGARYKTVSAKTRAEAQAKVDALAKTLRMGVDPDAGKQRLSEFLATWLEQRVKPRVRPNTYSSYELHIRLHIAPGLGHLRLNELRPQHMQTWMADQVKKGARTTRSIGYSFTLLKQALGQAVKWDLLERNPALSVDMPRHTKFRPQPFDEDETIAFLKAIEDEYLRALYVLCISTGIRQGEALALQWADVNWEKSKVTITKTLVRLKGVGLRLQDAPKTGASYRVQVLPLIALEALQRHRAAAIAAEEPTDGYVFHNGFGSPLDASAVSQGFGRMLKRLGLRKARFHDLRHCAASLAIANGVDIKSVSGMLGHSSISMTSDTYGHLFESTKRATANTMDKALRRTTEPATEKPEPKQAIH